MLFTHPFHPILLFFDDQLDFYNLQSLLIISMNSIYNNNAPLNQSHPNQVKQMQKTQKQSSHLIPIYKLLSKSFKKSQKNSKEWEAELKEGVQQLKNSNEAAAESVKLLVNAWLEKTQGSSDNKIVLSNEENCILLYWRRCCKFKEQSQWNYSQHLRVGLQVLAMSSIQSPKTIFSPNQCNPFAKYNNALCLYKLGMYQDALKIASQLIIENSPMIRAHAEQLKVCTTVRMGCKLDSSCLDGAEPIGPLAQRKKYLVDLKYILSMNKAQLIEFFRNCKEKGQHYHIANWYNLALAYKSKSLLHQATTILQSILNQSESLVNSQLRNRCYALLSQIHETEDSLSTSIAYLQKLATSRQIEMKIWCLKKKLKLRVANPKQVEKTLVRDPRYTMLRNLQSELKKICSNQMTLSTAGSKQKVPNLKITTKKKIPQPLNARSFMQFSITSKLSTPISKNKTDIPRPPTLRHSHRNLIKSKHSVHPSEVCINISNISKLSNSTLKHSLYPNQTPKTEVKSQRNSFKLFESNFPNSINEPQNQPQPQPQLQLQPQPSIMSLKKSVRFEATSDSQSESSKSLTGLASTYEQNIITYIIEQQFQDALDEIKDAQDHLQQLQLQDKSLAFSFTLKLSKWCRQAGKERYATHLLKRVIPRYEESQKWKIILLKQLSKNFENLKEYKSAIEVILELIKLGEIEYLDRLGEMHMLRENYSQSLKCYERYHDIKQNIYSLVKLAHASSKIPSYSKRAIELLNDILFENKTSCIFKKHTSEQSQDFQSALLLLVTIYMNLNGQKKAMQICEKYLAEDFGAYPIFYILGILKLREGHQDEAFHCFLNAIRLKPNHLPSLIQLLKFLKTNSSEVLTVLRKAFLIHHRDWELLQLLVEAASKTKSNYTQLSVQGLINSAKTLEGVCEEEDLHLEIEAVWLWAAELIDERQKRMSIVDQEYIENVYVRLGEISLKKGNYPASERYFSRVLQKLQIEGSRLGSQPKVHYVRLEIQILRRLAYLKSEQRQTESSMNFLQKSKEVAQRNGMSEEALSDAQKLGRIYFMLEKYQYAAGQFAYCSKIVQKLPQGLNADKNWQKWKELQLKKGDCYLNLRQWKDARKVYQGILTYRICEEAIRNLANLYAWQGSPELAKELLQSLNALHKNQSQL